MNLRFRSDLEISTDERRFVGFRFPAVGFTKRWILFNSKQNYVLIYMFHLEEN